MKKSILLATLSLALASELPAQQLEAGIALIEGRFKQLDADHDGKLSAEEARPIAELLRGADADGDGFFTLREVLGHLGRKAAKAGDKPPAGFSAAELETRFKQLDKDGNGTLEGAELSQARWLAKLAPNGNGSVTLEDVKAIARNWMEPTPVPTGAAPPPFEPREQAARLKPGEHGVEAMLPDAAFTDLDGKPHRLSDFTAKNKALVIALASWSCPVSKRYLPTLASFERQYRDQGVAFLLVASTATDTPEQLRAAFKDAGVAAPCAADPAGALAKVLGALSSTDVFVVDARRTLTYRGAIDDQYGLGYSLDAPRHRYLADALEAALAGQLPAIAATAAPGCALDLTQTPATPRTEITYHNRISRILQANCLECHRATGIAPFPLETAEQVAAKAGMIRKMVERRLMPPWFAAPPAPGAHSPWANDRSLAERDRADLLAWIAAGKPLGEPHDAPLARQWPGEWQIGKPDAIVQIASPIEVKATGTMPYQNVTVETNFGEDKWVRAFEVKPTAREVVHHVLIFVREKGATRRSDEDSLGGFFAAYVPGTDHLIYPEGCAKLLPGGASLRFQIHYTPNGIATRDQIRIGFLFAAQAPEHIVHVAGISQPRLSIPAGAENHPESASVPVPNDIKVLAFMPHMHVRGKAFRYDSIAPDGAERTLLEVPRYDFNWQLGYRYAEPPTIPAGSKIRATGWFDNSAKNPANPDPNKTVRWGQQTTDEMMLGYVEYYVPGEQPKVAGAAR